MDKMTSIHFVWQWKLHCLSHINHDQTQQFNTHITFLLLLYSILYALRYTQYTKYTLHTGTHTLPSFLDSDCDLFVCLICISHFWIAIMWCELCAISNNNVVENRCERTGEMVRNTYRQNVGKRNLKLDCRVPCVMCITWTVNVVENFHIYHQNNIRPKVNVLQ